MQVISVAQASCLRHVIWHNRKQHWWCARICQLSLSDAAPFSSDHLSASGITLRANVVLPSASRYFAVLTREVRRWTLEQTSGYDTTNRGRFSSQHSSVYLSQVLEQEVTSWLGSGQLVPPSHWVACGGELSNLLIKCRLASKIIASELVDDFSNQTLDIKELGDKFQLFLP